MKVKVFDNPDMSKGNSPLYFQSFSRSETSPVVILLHGLFGSGEMWRAVVDTLKDEYNVVVPKLPLFDLPTEKANVRHLTQLLHEFIQWNSFKDVVLIGHGLGGQIALLYARLYAGNVQQIVLTGSAGSVENSPVLKGGKTINTYHDVHEKISEAFYRPELISAELVEEVFNIVQNIPKRLSLWNLALSSRRVKVASFLSAVRQPVLMIWGLQDSYTPPEAALHFHDQLLNGTVRFIDQCGHVPMVERPEEFSRHLLLFLNANIPQSSLQT